MKPLLSASLFAACVFLACAGCSSVNSRIQSNPRDFAQASPQQQALIKQGLVEVGFSPGMVRIALGKPTEVERVKEEDGELEIWTYRGYKSKYRVKDEPVIRREHARSVDGRTVSSIHNSAEMVSTAWQRDASNSAPSYQQPRPRHDSLCEYEDRSRQDYNYVTFWLVHVKANAVVYVEDCRGR